MIKIIVIGKIKEKYLKDGINEYLKRLKKYTKIQITELSDESYNDSKKVLEVEAKKIEKYIGEKDYVITLEIDGNSLSSIEFSDKIEKLYLKCSNITFIIGGSLGLDISIKKRSNFALSFSKMTFPHQLFRLILLEQLYRCYKIINNETYHK